MKIIVKHKMNILQELNFRTFEVIRTFCEKGLEIYVPELKRKIDLSIEEVYILNLLEELDKSTENGNFNSERFGFLHNYISLNCVPEDHFLVLSADLWRYAKLN